MDALRQDLRYALRTLRQHPGFAVVAILTLALGIGANTAMFSVINTALFRPVHAARPESLVTLFNGDRDGRRGSSNHAYPDYLDLRRATRSARAEGVRAEGAQAAGVQAAGVQAAGVFDDIAAFTTRPVNMVAGRDTLRINAGLISDTYFRVLGVQPLAGRDFLPEENRAPGAHPVALISEGLWRRQFAAAPDLANVSLLLNNTRYAVVGVMPDAASRMAVVVKIDVFVPAMMQGAIRGGRDYLADRRSADFMLIGRLPDDVTLAQAQTGLDRLVADLHREQPEAWTRDGQPRPVTVVSERESRGIFELRGYVVGFATLLMGAVGAVLLIACANLANVLLARGLGRRQELAIRVSLGAKRGRLVRQLLTEGTLIAIAGGGAGFLVAVWVKGLFAAFEPQIGVPLVIDLSLDWRVLLFSAAITLVATLAFSLAPALQVTSPDLVSGLQEGPQMSAGRAAGSRRVSRVRRALLVGQVACSIVLLAAAGTFLAGLRRLTTIDLGFDADRVALLSVDMSMQGATPAAFVDDALARIARVPGVESVDVASRAPMGFSRLRMSLVPEDARGGAPAVGSMEEAPAFGFNRVGPRYFEVMGMPLIAGRAFSPDDRTGAPPVAIVNEVAARRFWPALTSATSISTATGSAALGRRLFAADGRALEIVGVVKASKYDSLTEDPVPYIYLPLAQQAASALTSVTLHVRSAGAPAAQIATLDAARRAIAVIDPRLPVFDVKTMNEHLAVGMLPVRAGAVLLGIFGALALGLASIGLYGALAYTVGQRSGELGLRLALGAQRRDLMRLVLGQGLSPLVWGTILGLVPCVIGITVIAVEFATVRPQDLTFLAAAIAVQVIVATVACWLPARRVLRLDPATTLRRG